MSTMVFSTTFTGQYDGDLTILPWNAWLDKGTVRTSLYSFESHSEKLNKIEAGKLFKLDGKRPMELVLMRADRDELLHVLAQDGGDKAVTHWRIQPELAEAVREAIEDYHAQRAPLYPLPKIQRLAYLDEQEQIQCLKDLGRNGRVIFKAGQWYPLRTQTVAVTRFAQKPNSFTGEAEDLVFSGQELMALVTVDKKEYGFTDPRFINDPNSYIGECEKQKDDSGRNGKADLFTNQQLAGHFDIPEVPDVASVHPERYKEHLATLETIEQLMNAI